MVVKFLQKESYQLFEVQLTTKKAKQVFMQQTDKTDGLSDSRK